MKKLQKLYQPYENIPNWQIKRARTRARECGPGLSVEKSSSYRDRVRLYTSLVDHMFVPRCCFWNPKIEAEQWPRNTHAKCDSNSYSFNYSHWGHFVQTPRILWGLKDKNSHALVVSCVLSVFHTGFV